MNYRNLSDIFPSYYVEKPTESYVRARCEAHLENAHVYRDFYEWIKPISCPYKREAYATIMLHMMEEKTMVDYEEERLCGSVLDEVEPELKKIIRYARTDQIADEMLYAEVGVTDQSTAAEPTLVEHVNELDARMAFLAYEVEQLKGKISTTGCFLLPDDWFATDISNDDRSTIEHMLSDLCNSNKRSASANLKAYLRLKQQQGLIIRPTQLNAEWETLCKMGYRRTYQAYQNA